MIEHEHYLRERIREIKEQDRSVESGEKARAPRAKQAPDYLPKNLVARTFSDDYGESLALVQRYFTETINLDVLTTKIATLMTKHEGDEAYQQRCQDAFAKRCQETKERILDAMKAWNPEKQNVFPN